MSTAAYPIRRLDTPQGIAVEVLGRLAFDRVRVRNIATGRTWETEAARLHKSQ